jgi:hypothetical protein
MHASSLFRTFASYYKNDKAEACRRYLDIKAVGFQAPSPELTVVTLNPGCQDGDDTPLDQETEIEPDELVIRLQEFMLREGLTWLRVLNLSDLQENSTDAFFKKLGEINELPEHSIFHPSREAELRAHASNKTPFLLAWGTDQRGGMLANSVVERIREQGYQIINPKEPFLHPLATPVGGIPSWTEYADSAFREYLKQKADRHKGSDGEAQNIRQQIASAFEQLNKPGAKNVIITQAKEGDRWEHFAQLLRAAGLHHYLGTSDYDYVLYETVRGAKGLHEALVKHNGKTIIIDATTEALWLSEENAFELLKAAVCDRLINNLIPQAKRPMQDNGEEPPIFKGQIVLLVGMTRKELESDRRFSCLLVDAVVV